MPRSCSIILTIGAFSIRTIAKDPSDFQMARSYSQSYFFFKDVSAVDVEEVPAGSDAPWEHNVASISYAIARTAVLISTALLR